jgi:hypothetical protein
MGKQCIQISASASVLLDAHRHINQYPSTAEDSGEPERNAKHFAQWVLNHADVVELDGTQAAGIVLGHDASSASAFEHHHYSWDVVKFAQKAARGDLDIDHAWLGEEEEENDDDDDDDTECKGVVDSGGDFGSDSELEDMHGGLHSGDEGDADAEGGATLDGTQGHATAEQLNLLHKFSLDTGTRSGQSRIYTDKDGNKIPVTDAEHYAYRSDELRCNLPSRNRAHTARRRGHLILRRDAPPSRKPSTHTARACQPIRPYLRTYDTQRTYRHTPRTPLIRGRTRRSHTHAALDLTQRFQRRRVHLSLRRASQDC